MTANIVDFHAGPAVIPGVNGAAFGCRGRRLRFSPSFRKETQND
jgi:hypothetical protein